MSKEMKTVPVRSAQEIVEQTEALALLLMKNVYQLEVTPGTSMRDHENPRAQHCWRLACLAQQELTATDPEDALSELEEGEQQADNEPVGYVVIQEGGASNEAYAHSFDSFEDAQGYREDCDGDGSYRTSIPVPVPLALLDQPGFMDVADAIAKAAVNTDYPENT